jgi:hypothetical protein
MSTTGDEPIKLLQDGRVLRLAYYASSDRVLHESFKRVKELAVFRGHAELASSVLEQYLDLVTKVRDPVILGAHLYALELTGVEAAVRKAVVATLKQKERRQFPMVAQMAAKIGARLARRKLPPGGALSEQEIDEIQAALGKRAAR